MSVNSSLINVYDCLDLSEVLLISVAYTFTKVLLAFPLCALVLYLVHRRGASSRSDHFTEHIVAMELLSEAGWDLLCWGSFTHLGLNVFFIVYTVMSIMAVLWLLFLDLLVCFSLTAAPLLNIRAGCVAMISAVWFKLPSSLVSPLFFLYRTLTCCCSPAKD